jgi:hypothetical protein
MWWARTGSSARRPSDTPTPPARSPPSPSSPAAAASGTHARCLKGPHAQTGHSLSVSLDAQHAGRWQQRPPVSRGDPRGLHHGRPARTAHHRHSHCLHGAQPDQQLLPARAGRCVRAFATAPARWRDADRALAQRLAWRSPTCWRQPTRARCGPAHGPPPSARACSDTVALPQLATQAPLNLTLNSTTGEIRWTPDSRFSPNRNTSTTAALNRSEPLFGFQARKLRRDDALQPLTRVGVMQAYAIQSNGRIRSSMDFLFKLVSQSCWPGGLTRVLPGRPQQQRPALLLPHSGSPARRQFNAAHRDGVLRHGGASGLTALGPLCS